MERGRLTIHGAERHMGRTVAYVRTSLVHQPAKLAISVASIAAALTLMMLILGFRSGLYASVTAYVSNAGADLFVGQQGATGVVASSSAVSADLAGPLREISGASQVETVVIADSIFQAGERKTPVLLVGYEPGQRMGGPWQLVVGREPNAGTDEITLDRWLARRDGIVISDQVEILGRRLEVVGLTAETNNWMSPVLFVPAAVLTEALGTPDQVSFFLLNLPPGANLDQIAADIERSQPTVHAMAPSMLADHDRRVLAAVMETPLLVMLVISSVIGTAVLGLTSYTAALDRMREYGVLKAIGASPARMNTWLLQEGLLRAALGYLAGVGVSLGSAALIQAVWPQFTIVITGAAAALTGAVLVIMAGLGSILPLRKVHRLDPALVFRGGGRP